MAFDTRPSGSPLLSTALDAPTVMGRLTRASTVPGIQAVELPADENNPQGAAPHAHGDGAPRTGAEGTLVPPARSGALRWLPRHLANGVGRRLLAMFVVTALAPVALMAGLSFTQVSDAMRLEHDAALVHSARAYGLAVLDRLRSVESLVAVAATGAYPAAGLTARVGHELEGFIVLDRKGRALAQGGRPPPLTTLGTLPASAAPADRRSALLTWPANGGAESGLAYAMDESSPIATVAVTLSPAFLWAARDADPQQPGFCVLSEAGVPLFCPVPLPDEARLRLTAAAAPGERLTQFSVDGTTMRAGAAVLKASAHFLAPDIVIAAARKESQLLDPTLTFRRTFLPIAGLSVLLVLLLSLVEVRRILVPLHAVLDGMRRVAARDFGSPVPVLDRDEFGQMAESFNSMTAQLGLHFRTLSAFAEIDRTILTTVDIRQVADIALDCIQEISRIKVVSLGLLEADSPDCTKVYLRADDGTTLRDELPRALDLSAPTPACASGRGRSGCRAATGPCCMPTAPSTSTCCRSPAPARSGAWWCWATTRRRRCRANRRWRWPA
jgi:HAMP domain-containing protein